MVFLPLLVSVGRRYSARFFPQLLDAAELIYICDALGFFVFNELVQLLQHGLLGAEIGKQRLLPAFFFFGATVAVFG